MAGGKLTDKAIKNAKLGERLAILADGGGLQLWLTPTGGKLWNYAYRFGGKRKRFAIGPYGKDPAGVPLEAARKRRDEAAGHSDVWKDLYQKSGIDVMDLMPSADLTVTTGKKFEAPKSTVTRRTLSESGGHN
jgi:hypothetical protein